MHQTVTEKPTFCEAKHLIFPYIYRLYGGKILIINPLTENLWDQKFAHLIMNYHGGLNCLKMLMILDAP